MKNTIKSLIQALNASRIEENPEEKGWNNCIEIAKEWGCSVGYAGKRLREGIEKGIIEVKRFRVKRETGFRIVPYYREKASLSPCRSSRRKD